jgi:polysaccharide pyruvyl transferase WcaK-like protein
MNNAINIKYFHKYSSLVVKMKIENMFSAQQEMTARIFKCNTLQQWA